MNRIANILTLIILILLSTPLLAQPGRSVDRPQAAQGAAQQNNPSPNQMAQMLLQNFDRDRNGELNLKELSAAMAALQQRMQQFNRGGAGGAGGFGGQGGGAGGRGGAGGFGGQGGGAGGRGGAGGFGGQGGGAGGRGGAGGKRR